MTDAPKAEFLTVWDGIKIDRLPVEEADKLEKAGKVQVYRNGQWPGELKHRRDFPGYKNREMRAGPPDEPAPGAPVDESAPDESQAEAEKKPARKRTRKAAKK